MDCPFFIFVLFFLTLGLVVVWNSRCLDLVSISTLSSLDNVFVSTAAVLTTTLTGSGQRQRKCARRKETLYSLDLTVKASL